MRIARTLVLGFVMALAAAGLAARGLSEDARGLCDAWAEKYNAADVEGVVARFDDTSELSVQREPGHRIGRGAAREYFKGLFAKYRVHFRFTHRFTEVLPVLIGQSGRYEEDLTPIAGGPIIHREGNFIIHFLRKSDPRVWVVQKIWI